MKAMLHSLFYLMFISAGCSSNSDATIIFDNANLMDKPSSQSKLLTVLKNKTKVKLLEVDKVGENFDENYYNYWKKVKLSDKRIGWVFGHYLATDEEQIIINLANNHLKTLTSKKDGIRKDNKSYRYIGIFFRDNVWCVEYKYKSSKEHILGACNVVIIKISKDKKIIEVNCLS